MLNKFSTKLSTKLFIITLGLLITLMATTLFFQLFLFEKFYEKEKINSINKEITTFKNMYSYESNINSILNAMASFEESTNTKIAICSFKGEIIYLKDKNNPDSYDAKLLKAYCEQILNNNKDIVQEVSNSNIIKIEPFTDSLSSTKKIGAITGMSLSSKNDCILIAVASVQPIKEATTVISKFFIYIFIGFIILSIFLSSLYSDIISKPLIKINNIAKKMSTMDFSQTCVVNRNDEIGNLADTLNFLSSNLDGALKDLKKKNKQLQEDIDKERQLEAMRKDFVDSVSHELKTPIGIIEGYAEGIKDGIVSGEKSHLYLETIIDESKKMGRLVSNMLELSKLESGVIKPSFEVFNINRLINKIVNTHSTDAISHNLNLIFNAQTEYSYVFADIFQMEQVLTNLITNAIKYTPPKNNIYVTISEENNLFKISVINEGSRINSAEIPKLFDKFYRIDKARQRNTNSTGLGLPIVKRLLELHGFTYSLENIEKGVEFKYYLPKAEPNLL